MQRAFMLAAVIAAVVAASLPVHAVPARIDDVPLPGRPSAVAFDPVSKLAYVAVENAGVVSVVAGAGSALPDTSAALTLPAGQAGAAGEVARINLGATTQPRGVAADGRFVYVTAITPAGGASIFVIQGARIVNTVSLLPNAGPLGVAADPVNRKLCVAVPGFKEIDVFDTTTAATALPVAARIVADGAAGVAADRGRCYATSPSFGIVHVVDLTATPAPAESVPGGIKSLKARIDGGPTGIAADPLTGLVWVANTNADIVSVVNPLAPAADPVQYTLDPGSHPTGIAASGRNVYVTDFSHSFVVMLNPANGNRAKRPTGIAPNAVAVMAPPASTIVPPPDCALVTNQVGESAGFLCDVL